MLRIAFMFRLIIIDSIILFILHQLHVTGICVITAYIIMCVFLLIVFVFLSDMIIRAHTRRVGKPTLGIITRIDKGLRFMGESEHVVTFVTTDGSHVLNSHTINTLSIDPYEYVQGAYCVMYVHGSHQVLERGGFDVTTYFEDEDILLLESLLINGG